MLNEKDIQLIDDFLEGKLTSEEKDVFNNRLKNDEEFKNEFKFVSSISKAFNREEIKEELSQIEKEFNFEQQDYKVYSTNFNQDFNGDKSTKAIYKYKNIAVAAGFVLLIGSIYFIFNQNPSSSHESMPTGGALDIEEHGNESIDVEDSSQVIDSSKIRIISEELNQ